MVRYFLFLLFALNTFGQMYTTSTASMSGDTLNVTNKLVAGSLSPVTIYADTNQVTLGTELVTNGDFSDETTGWTVGNGWSRVSTGNMIHTSGTAALSQSITGFNNNNRVYFVLVKTKNASLAAGVTVGTLTMSLDTVGGSSLGTMSITHWDSQKGDNYFSWTLVPNETTTRTLTFTPTTKFVDTIVSVSIREITSEVPLAMDIRQKNMIDSWQIRTPNNLPGISFDHPDDWTSQSISIGFRNFRQHVAGFQNNALGVETMRNVTTGEHNNGFGQGALYGLTTGWNNSAFGHAALQYTVTGSRNSALGHYAGYLNLDGNDNCWFGDHAGFYQYRGSTNNGFGAQVLYYADSTFDNCGFGYKSQLNTRRGDKNSSYGNYSAENLTSANLTTSMGYYALHSDTSGSYLVAIGAFALEKTKRTTENVAVGYQALQADTTGEGNTAVGYQAGKAMTTGSNNALYGQGSGGALTTGQNNTFIGTGAGATQTTTNNVTGVGRSSLSASTGSSITALGASSGGRNTTGGDNLFLHSRGWYDKRTTSNGMYVGDSISAITQAYIGVGRGEYGGANLHIGGLQTAIDTIKVSRTLSDSLHYVLVSDSSAGVSAPVITLPVTNINDGQEFVIKSIGTGTVLISVVVSGGGTIDGVASNVITTAYVARKYVKYGSNYYIF